MAKIEKLTPEQEAQLPIFRDKWIGIGLCTEPADRPRAEAALTAAYRQAGLEPPRFVWCGSVLAMALTRAIVMKLADDPKLRRKIGASVGASVRASVGDSVWASVWASVGASGYGQHDANWLGFYDFFRHIGLVKETAAVEPLTELAQAANWFLPHKGICWISERHCVVMQDERKRLHCLTGPAVRYPDGWSIYAVHGVRVPDYVVERPDEITAQKIDAEANAEIRRVMIERYGAKRWLLDGGAVKVAEDEFGILWRKERHGDAPIQLVEVVNGSPEPDGSYRTYHLRVPSTVRTALEAVAWTYDMPADQYRHLAVRT